jgi:integrase
MNKSRTRYQQGSLTIDARRTGPSVWLYRWREVSSDGTSKRRKQFIGTKSDYPSKAAALRAVEVLRLDINAEVMSVSSGSLSVGQLIEHYRMTELCDNNCKTLRTKQVYEHQLAKVIAPKWSLHRLQDVKPIAVETWLNGMPVAPGTRYKTKGVMSILYQHAMRYGWATANPIRLVRQSALPLQEEIVLSPIEVAALLVELRDPFHALILLASVTGLRRGELFGLKWEDVNFRDAEIGVVRSLVDQVEGPPKTLASRRPLPMSLPLALSLSAWREQTSFPCDGDWMFASPSALGRKPYWPDAVLKRHILPAAERAGITKRIGWHSFRRTLATLLQSSGASVKTTQDLMRHSSPLMTLGTYAKAVTADKRLAQDAIAALFVGRSKQPIVEMDPCGPRLGPSGPIRLDQLIESKWSGRLDSN